MSSKCQVSCHVDIDLLLRLSAQKCFRICCAPSAGIFVPTLLRSLGPAPSSKPATSAPGGRASLGLMPKPLQDTHTHKNRTDRRERDKPSHNLLKPDTTAAAAAAVFYQKHTSFKAKINLDVHLDDERKKIQTEFVPIFTIIVGWVVLWRPRFLTVWSDILR